MLLCDENRRRVNKKTGSPEVGEPVYLFLNLKNDAPDQPNNAGIGVPLRTTMIGRPVVVWNSFS